MCRRMQEGRVRYGKPNRVDFEDVALEYVDEFCYFGDMICAKGYMEASSIAGIRNELKMFWGINMLACIGLFKMDVWMDIALGTGVLLASERNCLELVICFTGVYMITQYVCI